MNHLVGILATSFAVGLVAAAPVPPPNRDALSGGLVTKADLDRLEFGPRSPEGIEDAVRKHPGNRFAALAVHLPRTRVRVGEPVPAYFVVRNTNPERPLGLDMRLDLFPSLPQIRNSCAIKLVNRVDGSDVGYVTTRTIACGGGPHIEIPKGGYSVARGDLSRCGSGPLPVGEYEVSWVYAGIPSNVVRFSVVGGRDAPRESPRVPAVRFLEITEHDEREQLVKRVEERGDPPIVWRKPGLVPLETGGVAAELGAGVDGKYYPDLHDLTESDTVMQATADWEGNRVLVTLRPNRFGAVVPLKDEPHLYLMVVSDDRDDDPKEAMRERARGEIRASLLRTPLTIDIRLPKDWRKQAGVSGKPRVAVLVSTKKIEPKNGQMAEKMMKEQQKAVLEADEDPPWGGVLRTPFKEFGALNKAK